MLWKVGIVPITKIISRYQRSILNAYRALDLVDRVYLYDNSIEDFSPRLIVRFSNGQIIKRYALTPPRWVNLFLD